MKNIKKVVMIIFLIPFFSFSLDYIVHADGEIKKNNIVDVTIKPELEGSFDLVVPPISESETVEDDERIKRINLSFKSSFSITDISGIGGGWDLTVSSEPLKSMEHKLPSGSLSLNPPMKIQPLQPHDDLPDIKMSKNSIIDNGEVLVVRAKEETGSGDYELEFGRNALILVYNPKHVVSGSYHTTLVWKLISKNKEKQIIKKEKIEVNLNNNEDEEQRVDFVDGQNNNDGFRIETTNEVQQVHYESDNHANEKSLPKTATMVFNYLFFGFVVLLLGLVLLIFRRKDKRAGSIN